MKFNVNAVSVPLHPEQCTLPYQLGLAVPQQQAKQKSKMADLFRFLVCLSFTLVVFSFACSIHTSALVHAPVSVGIVLHILIVISSRMQVEMVRVQKHC